MCGSLLSKFKRRSNIVVPVSSAESLTQERVKESFSEDAKTVRWALPSANSNLPRNNILEVRPYDSTTEKCCFHSSPSAHSTADKSEKQTEAEIRCAPESEPTCVEVHAKQKPDFGSSIQWHPSSNLQERKSVSVCLTARSVSERELCHDKTETKSKAAAGSKEVEAKPDSKFKDDDDSESSIKEISAKPSSKPAAACQVSDGKIKNVNEPRCRSASCLNGTCSEPRPACMVENESIASTDQDSNSTNERDSETDEKEDQLEPDNSTNICLECCETRCESKRLTTKADSESLIDCDSAAGLDGKGSEVVLQPVSGCDSVVRLKKNATEPATEPNIECHLNAWVQEKDTNTVFQSEIAMKSCGRITEKQAFTDCKPAINRRRASFLCDRDFGCAADYVSEAGSEADARIAPTVIVSDSTAAQNDSYANLESKVGKLCCNIITRKPFCPLVQEKKEKEQNSEDTEHPPTAEIVMANIEHNNTCLAEIASCPQFELKTEVDSKPDFYYRSADKVAKSVPEAGNQLEVRCDSKASMRAISTHLDAVTIEKHVEGKDIIIKQTQEKEASSTDQEVLSSENSGSNGQKRPAHTKSFPSASASAVASVQDEPHTAFSAMSVHASAASEDDRRRLENDQLQHGTDLKVSRQIIIKGIAKATKQEMTTEKSGWGNPSTSQRHSESAVTPGNLDVLFERARKELECRILRMTTNKDQPNYKFLSANKELLLSKAREELEKRLLKIALSSKEAVSSPRKRNPAIQENRKVTCADNCDAALATARTLFEKTFREKVFQKGQLSDNSLRWFTLAKTKNYVAFNVFCARKSERSILLSARVPFNLRKFDVTHQLTSEAIKAKLERAQEKRLRELERVRRRAHRLGRLRGRDEENNRKGVG